MNKQDSSARTQTSLFWKNKPFWIAIASVVAAVAIQSIAWTAKDKPLKIESPTSMDSQPDYANGIGINYKERFYLMQEDRVLPADENGWKLLLQNFGPLVLEQKFIAERVPWEAFPVNESTKVWYETFWTPVCEKFGIDPSVKPTYLGRLDLTSYLIKNGVTGADDEKVALERTDDLSDSDDDLGDPDDDPWGLNAVRLDPEPSTYYEGYEEHKGRISGEKASDAYNKLLDAPWTGKDNPCAERWLEENADAYAVYEKAIRMPKFRMWHLVGDEPLSFIAMLLPDVQHIREIARLFAIRANYRVANGDIDGAIDDVDTILRYSKSLFNNGERCLIEGLVGIAVANIGASIQIGGNQDAQPTAEQWTRYENVWNEQFGSVDFRAAAFENFDGQYNFLFLSCCQDITLARREGKEHEILAELNFEAPSDSKVEKIYQFLAKRSVLFRGPFDDAKFMQEAIAMWNRSIERLKADEEITILSDEDIRKERCNEKKMAAVLFNWFMPSTSPTLEAYRRLGCVSNMRTIGVAMLRYQAEHGTLPPAFTVDAEGKPLQSWRTLILPYLGEEEKALYEKIKLDEPWNSEYNKQFHASAPKVYRCPTNLKCQSGDSAYSVILGEDALFDASGKGKSLTELMKRADRKTLRQALVVERVEPGCWMSPERDMTEEFCRKSFVEASEQGDCMGAAHAEIMDAVLANGAVIAQAFSGSPEELISGCEPPADDVASLLAELGMPAEEQNSEEPVAETPTDENVAEASAEENAAEESVAETPAEETPSAETSGEDSGSEEVARYAAPAP